MIKHHEISVTDVKLNLGNDNFMVIDVREPYEYEICNIGSLNIPMSEIKTSYCNLPKDKHIAILCKSGKRASAVANLLITEYDFESISVISGGIDEWINKIDNSLEAY
jgi:rhodanese-related sulfurtransferase